MISTLLATMAMSPSKHLSFTLILVAGNEHPIIGMKDLEEPTTEMMTAEVQKLTKQFDKEKRSFMFLDGGKIAESMPNDVEPSVFMLGKSYSPEKKVSEDIVRDGKTVRMTGYQSASRAMTSINMNIFRQDRMTGAGFSNTLMGEKSESLFLSPLGSLLAVNKEVRLDYSSYYPNQLAISRYSLDETGDWLKANTTQYKPSLVLCSSGSTQNGNSGMLAFPPSGVILTYQVTFDKKWSAKLKDVTRVQ
jgi:hypothetical protein